MRHAEKTGEPTETLVHFDDGGTTSVVGAIETVARDLGGQFTRFHLHAEDRRFAEAAHLPTDGNVRPILVANSATRYAITEPGKQRLAVERFSCVVCA
ncbi:MAG: hypothetical protein AB7T19_20400 [Planctomycetota bacterium]